MTTESIESRRISFKPHVVLAALGLALALLPSATHAAANPIPLLASTTLASGATGQMNAVVYGGNTVYAVGFTSVGANGLDILISRWSQTSLGLLSSATYNGTANGDDMAQGAVLDGSNNLYVVGVSSKNGTGSLLWMGKFSSAATLISSGTYNIPVPTYISGPTGIVMSGGNLFVAGTVLLGGNSEVLIAKFDTSLNFLSSTTFFNGFDANNGNGITADSSGDLYVAGSVAPAPATSSDLWVGKFAPNLVFIASRTVAGGGGNSDQAFALKIDPSESFLFVAGTLNTTGVIGSIYLSKLSLGLAHLQTATFQGSGPGYSTAYGIAVDNNRVYLAGGTNTGAQGQNIFLGEYNYSLSLLSSSTLNSGGSANDQALGLALDLPTRNAYVVGQIEPSGNRPWLGRYRVPTFTSGVEVVATSTAPVSIDGTSGDVPVLYLDMIASISPATFGSFQLGVFGDLPSNLASADFWLDDGDGVFNPGTDVRVSSVGFSPPGGGLPATAYLPGGNTLSPGLSTRFYFTVRLTGAPSGRKLSFGFLQPGNFGVPNNDLSFPLISNQSLVRVKVYANPVNGVNNFAFPVSGAVNSGGLDTGLFIQAGQRVSAKTEPGDLWNVSASTNADGLPPNEGLGAFNRGALVGRIGSSPWLLLGQVSTITASASGTLYVAANDANYTGNTGFIRASFDVLPATTSKVWLGGVLGFENSADINANWVGGRPFPGETAVFDSSAYDCDWNIPNVALASLFVSTAYTRTIRLTPPPYQFNARLTVDGDATIRGGTFDVGVASGGQTNVLSVKGRLVVRDTATFALNGALELGLGAEFQAGARLQGSGSAEIRRASPSTAWYMRVDNATVSLSGSTNLMGSDYIVLSTPTILAMDNLTFGSFSSSTSPLVRLYSGVPVAYVFNNWSANPPARTPYGLVAALPSGSSVTFNASITPSGTSFGSPSTDDPNAVVKWIPDGGGTPATITGTLSSLPGDTGTFRVIASTSPDGVDNTSIGGGGATPQSLVGSPSAYVITGLRAPSTYYIFAYVDAAGQPGAHSPRGGFGHVGEFRSEPVFIPSAGAPSGINVTMKPWGAVAGAVTNASSQSGPLIVETWEGPPNLSISTRQARGTANPAYLLPTPADFGSVLHSSAVFAFVDVNRNGSWETFEASATIMPISVTSLSTTTVGLSILGGNPAPGGTVTLTTAAVHLGAIGAAGYNPLIRSRFISAGGAAELSALRVRYQGGPLPNPGSSFGVWADDGDGLFDPALDSLRGSAPIFTLGPATYTVTLAQPVSLPVGTPKFVFVTLDVNNSGLGYGTGGVMIDAATSYTLSAGTFSFTPSFPLQTGALPILAVVRASATATDNLQGGTPTGSFVFTGQMISVTSTGSWRTGPGDAPTGPDGAPGTTGLNTVLPAANRGELIGRVFNSPNNTSTPWVRIGASTTAFPSPGGGELRLAINDFVGAYSDNSGAILAGFVTSGSSVGALSGQVFYSTPNVAGTLTVFARLNGSSPMGQTSFGVAASSSYPYFIGGLPPGQYDLSVQHGSSSDYGLSVQEAHVSAGATSYLDATMYKATGAITGLISYSGVLGVGAFDVGVATVTDFTGEVHFFGSFSSTAPAGAYAISGLPAPATYYVVAFRDGDANGKPNGSEPLGYFGVPGAGLSTFASSMTPVYVVGGSTIPGVSFSLQDNGAIEGAATLLPGATGALIVEAGRGLPGTPGYTTESRIFVPVPPGGAPAGGLPYKLGLLRPATGYTFFAFLDKNSDGQPSAGEEQTTRLAAIAVPSGGTARLDFSLAALTAPAAPAFFTATPGAPGAVSTITFSWNLSPGATGYLLRRANNSVFATLGASASVYFDTLPNNTSSQIRSITASNGNGVSTTTSLSSPVYTFATIPTLPIFVAVTATGAFVSWGGTNPPGTTYDLQRATAATGSMARVFLGTSTGFFNDLAPASTYFWTVLALNGGGVTSSLSPAASTVTLPLAGPSLSGMLSYAGAQKSALGQGFVIEASTSATTFFPRVSSAALPGAALQPWYLPVPPSGTYFVRAYINLAGNGTLLASADRGQTGAILVVASSVTANFSVTVDTVPPGAPAGVVAVPGFNQIALSWAPPTKNANGSNLIDLAAFVVSRATSPTAAFAPLTPLGLSSSTLSFVDLFPLPGIINFYVVRARDLGGNLSAPSGTVSAAASAGGSISGQIRDYSPGAGDYRVRLSTQPSFSAPSVAERALSSYTFTGLPDGVYYLRAYRDLNGNGVEDPLSDPAGAFGGLNLPFPISIVNGNAVPGADATICGRAPLQAPFVTGLLQNGVCPALDKGPGFTTVLFALAAGGGLPGSLGVGTQINLAVSTDTTFATDLILLGPDGHVFGRDNRVGGANLTVALSSAGIYLAELTSFQPNGFGVFKLNIRLEGGFAGTAVGSVTYAGARPGLVYTQLFNSANPLALPILTSTASAAASTGFTFPGLPDGTYFLRTFRDSNGNGVRDAGEPAGQYGVSASSPSAVVIAGGFALGAPFILPASDPAVGTVRGAALYEGTAPGALRVEAGRSACPGCSSIGEIVAFSTVAPGGVYTLSFLPSATDYVVRAFVDSNGNGQPDALESAISTFPVTVFVNATSTISLIVRDAGAGAFGTAIVAGTVTYTGASTGPIIIGLSHDPQFRSVDYLLVLPATGYFSRSGLQGDSTYYMAGFIDMNLNNSPDYALGEPAAAGSTEAYVGTPLFDNPPPIFVTNHALTTVQLLLTDPPDGSVFGTVRYTGSSSALNIVVRAYPVAQIGFAKPAEQIITRVGGVTDYAYHLSFLPAKDHYINAFLDANGNGQSDNGEPFGGTPPVQVSSGLGSYPTYGVDVGVLDPGSLGGALAAGRIRGEMVYFGTQSGSLYVRFFNNSGRHGSPLYTLTVPAPVPGSGEFQFDRPGLPFGTYYLDAFRDPTGVGVYNPSAHAHGVLNSGNGVEVTQERSDQHVFGGTISDPGQGGSVNAYTGSFTVAGGARFDGGATDLAAIVRIDSTTSYGPQPIVLGLTAQNGGVEAWAVRYSSNGLVLSTAVISSGKDDLHLGSFATDNAGSVFVDDRIEQPNSNASTATLTEYDANWAVLNYNEIPDYQGLEGLTYNGGYLFAASRYIPTNQLRALKINPATLAIQTAGSFSGTCSNCQSRVQGVAMSPNGSYFVVYGIVNQQNDGDRGVHFLLRFNTPSTMNLITSKDITALGGPSRGGGVSMAVDDSGSLYLAFVENGDTARTYKFDVSGAVITQTASASYGPIQVHFSGGLGNLQLDPASGQPFEVWESTTGAGDYMLLRYDQSLNLTAQRFFDGNNNTGEDTGFSLAVYNSSQVFVTGAINNGNNLDWGTVRLNGNGSGSASGFIAPVAITTANAVDFISGVVSYGGSLVTSGTVRMSLTSAYSDVPIRFATAAFGGTAPFLFNHVPDGLYDVRAFIDPNGSFSPEAGEPIGATTLVGVEFAAGNDLTLADPVQLCDRRVVAFDVDVVQSFTAADCTSPDRAGAPRRLYTFRGTRGQPVTIALKALGFYDSYLDLYGPDGGWLEYSDDDGEGGNALISNYVLPEDGLYTIDAQAYASGSFGQFKLSVSGSAGALGGIAGRVDYAGSQGGAVIVGLFASPVFSSATAAGRVVLTSTRAFAFGDLSVGSTYYLGAFIDVNANQVPDAGEDSGVFGAGGVPSPILLAAGQVVSGVEIAVLPSSASAASAAYMTGTASYAGTRTGSLVLEFWSNSQFTGHPIASRVVPTGAGSFDVAVPGGVPYYVRGFLDVNGDFALQPDEPRGVFAPHGQGAEQVFAPVGQTLVGIDVALKDPGQTAGGAFAGEGTAVLSSTYAVTGQKATLVVVYTVGPNGVAATGQIGFTAPPGFSFPVFSAAGSSVTVASTAAAFGAVTYSGPSAFVTPTSPLVLGQQVVFVWSNFYAPCAVGAATVTVSAVQNNTAAPQPLFLGSPSLALVSGAAQYVQLDEPYFSVKQGELSDVRRLESRDACGARAAVGSLATVDLRTKRFNGVTFVPDAEVGVTTSAVLSTAAAVSVDFEVGQSSKSFYVLAQSTGFKNLEVHYNLLYDATYYFGVSAVPANALTSVSVSTASGGVALSSASVGLGANGQPNQIFVNFTLGDPQQSWHVLISSLPFKSGERPSAVWERWGFGQPNAGEIAWDGRFSPWISGGVRVPNGLYYGRVELGGGGVKDDAIRLTVALPQFAGRVFDPGTVPNPPLPGAQLRVYGPAGYFTAATDGDGGYVLPGLGAGSYRLNVSRPDFVDGALDMVLNGAGAAISFIPRTPGVLVSSNAAGGLDLFISRAPKLIVVPSLDPSVAASAAVQWGSLQVRPSTAAQQSATFYGPMRLNAGTTTFDDGGQWDSSTQQFIAKTLLGFNVPVGTYTVLADLSGFSRSTGSVYVGPDGARLDLPAFLPKAVISGFVGRGAGNPAPPGGQSVGVTGIALSTAVATTGLSAGAFIAGGSTYAAYSISGFDAGAYLLRANTQGLSAVTTGPIVVAGTAAVSGVNFPDFGAGASITGVISAVAPNGTRIFVNAWSPGSFNFGSTVVYVSANAASYALGGLDAGATYQLYANIEANADYDLTAPTGGFPIKVLPPATQNFTLAPASGVISGLILLRAGSTDFTNVTLTGVTIASLHPDQVGHYFVETSTALPNFLCADGSSGATGYCPPGVSSATFKVQGATTETIDVRMLHTTTGQSSRHTVSSVNGSTVSFTSDLRGSTFTISGRVINQITDTFFNTNEKIALNAPFIKPLNYPAGLSSTTARVTATRQEIDAFGVAISTVFDPISSRVGFLDASGDYTIPNCPNGVYVVRTADLRSCATCAIIAPSVGRVISVSGASVSSVTLTVSNGYSVSGSIALDGGLLDAQVFDIRVLNRRQEIVRSTFAYLGDLNLGQQSGSVDYSFANLPAGEFYTLSVRGLIFPIKYAGRPIKFPDPALSPAGLQSNLVRQDVLMQRAAYLTGRLKDGGTGELITANNAALLAPNFAITATANPWTEGGFAAAASSVAARPIEADGFFRVGPLVPDVSYDLRLAQATWDPNFLSNGSQNYAPVTIGGLKPTPGEIRDIGVIALGQGQSVTGVVKSTATGLALGNIKVTARPSFGGDALVVQTFTNSQGLYSLWVSSLVSNQFNLIAAPRDGNQASDGKYYGTVSLSNVNLQTQTSANFLLTPLSVVVTGQLVVADFATGGALSYPFGDKRGFPAGAVNLQPVGVVPNNPLGDIEATTDQSGFFSIPGLSTGVYALHATSLGYAVYNASVQVIGSSFSIFTGSNTAVGPLTLARGATATGRILKSDGTAPNSNEVVGVAAANFGAGEFVVGSVETDAVAKTVSAYTISGFKPGVNYNIVLLSGLKGREVSFPPEGAGVVFTAADSSTTKTINLTYRPAALDCLGTAKALDAARTQFAVQIDCLKPLRQQTANDDDLTAILTLSTFTQAGSALAPPNGTGTLTARLLSSDRRRLTGTYSLAPSETRFTMRVRASASEVDPRTGDNFAIDKVFDFYAGLDAAADGRASNINGGSVGMNPSAQDELLGLDERSRIDLPPGAFGEGSDSLPDAGVVANPTTTVNVSMTKGRDQALAKALSIAAVGYAPAALEVADVPSAFPSEMWAAMSKYRTQAASTTTVGGANPISAFYSIFLPAGIRHQLKQRADLTLSYNLATSTSTTDDKIQVWFYNAVLGRFVLENTNRRLDSVNKTVTVSVDHFSTFVVLDSTPTATSTVSFGGAEIAVANFPNPADCITHSNIARNSTLFGSGGVHAPFVGTMLRASIPLSGTAQDLRYNIYTVAGEKIRTIEQGVVPAGQTYYTPWNCANDSGRTVASGVYIGEVIHGGRRKFFKIAIIKGSGL